MKFSLKKKTILLIAMIGFLIGLIAVLIYDKGIHDIIQEQYSNQSIDISKTVAVEVDADRVERLRDSVMEIYNSIDHKVMSDQWGTPEFDEYISHYSAIEESEDFLVLRDQLRKIQDVNQVNCLYITWLDTVNERMIYLVDAAYEDACPPGCIDPIYGDFHETLKNPELGFAPNITNTPEYGWIIATDLPIHNDKGEIVGFSAVDMSMNDIMNKEYRFLMILAGLLFLVTVIICLIGIQLVGHFIVNPINILSKAASNFTAGSHCFSKLKIRRGDEIGELADSMIRMEQDIDGYIANLVQTKDELLEAREHAEQMESAANIDALTKVRNKRAYDVDIERFNDGSTSYGLAMIDLNGLKEINDTYGHEKGDIAIKKLCAIVCGIFKHSPVYRIGGDEFVVVLTNTDYENRNALIGSFKDEIRKSSENPSLPPWERVAAAIGYSVFDKNRDTKADNVLERADKAMYMNKKEMKGLE